MAFMGSVLMVKTKNNNKNIIISRKETSSDCDRKTSKKIKKLDKCNKIHLGQLNFSGKLWKTWQNLWLLCLPFADYHRIYRGSIEKRKYKY